MPANYNEHTLQQNCRDEGCIFQIPIIPDGILPSNFYIGPTINLLPDISASTYLKNFWRDVTIEQGVIVRNIWPLIVIAVHSVQNEELTVEQVLKEIIAGLFQIFNTTAMVSPWITIPEQYYHSVVPRYSPHEPTFHALEIGFDYWLSKFDATPYQKALKIKVAYLSSS